MSKNSLFTVPQLITANPHPIEEIERQILDHQDEYVAVKADQGTCGLHD